MSAALAEQLRRAIVRAERRGMSRYAIAKRAGVALPYLIRVANGTAHPGVDRAGRIAEAVGYRLVLNRDSQSDKGA